MHRDELIEKEEKLLSIIRPSTSEDPRVWIRKSRMLEIPAAYILGTGLVLGIYKFGSSITFNSIISNKSFSYSILEGLESPLGLISLVSIAASSGLYAVSHILKKDYHHARMTAKAKRIVDIYGEERAMKRKIIQKYTLDSPNLR